MTAIELIALSKVKADRNAVDVGNHQVDFTVRVTGTVSVAKDTDKVSTVSIPVLDVLALFVARSGCTRDASLKLLKECLSEAITNGGGDFAADIDSAFKAQVKELAASLPRTTVKGAVKADIQVELVEANDFAIAAK